MEVDRLTSLILRVGVALTFFYAAIASLLDPTSWAGYMPMWIRSIFPITPLLTAFSIFELFLGLWLVSGKYPKLSGLVAAAMLTSITLANITQFDIIFRDVGLLAMCIAIITLHRKEKFF